MRLTPRPAARATPSRVLAATLALALVTSPGAATAQTPSAKPAPAKQSAAPKPAGPTATKAPARKAAARPISIHDVVGRWAMQVMLTSGDSTLVTHTLNITPELTGWTITFPNRAPIPVRVVAMAGDSIVTEAGPYESVLRAGGVQVTTRGVYRMRRGRLVGTTVAHYATSRPDSVLRVRSVGRRMP